MHILSMSVKTKIQNQPFLLLVVILSFFGCTKLLFENPVPNKGEVVQVLPEFFQGKFLKLGEQTYYEFERINEKHCIIYSTEWIQKDSIHSLIEGAKNDSTHVEFRKSTIIIKEKDTVQKIKLRLKNNRYYTEKKPAYELNLEKGYFIDDFDTQYKKNAVLKVYEQRYFLSIIDNEEQWFAIWLENKNDSLIIHNSSISDKSFKDNLDYYNDITKIDEIEDKTYLANPSDTEFFKLLEEPFLFNEEIWVRVNDKRQWKITGTIIGISILVLFILFMALRTSMDKNRLT